MGVDHPERRRLLAQVGQDAGNDDVLDHIGEVAGVKGVAVVHGEMGRRRTGYPLALNSTGKDE
jgi:hypothetical protein